MDISKAKDSDVQEIEKLVNSAYRGESSKKGWTTEADLLGGIRIDSESLLNIINSDDSDIFVYKVVDKIEGCVTLVAKEKILYLGMLTVNPTLQNSGIGKQLLRFVDNYAAQASFDEIEMTVISKRNELIAWYERHGYFKTDEKRPFPMTNPKFGIPKTELEFIVLKKSVHL